jgi:hypothetical protein
MEVFKCVKKKEFFFAKKKNAEGEFEFHPLVFWANPIIIARFPLHAELARSQFAGLPFEASCERTFSYAGRVRSDLRSDMSAEQLCAHVAGHAGGQ